jgi:hypothetical protein
LRNLKILGAGFGVCLRIELALGQLDQLCLPLLEQVQRNILIEGWGFRVRGAGFQVGV